MNDIYLVKRESNRGCWVLGLAALAILFLAWFVFFHDPIDSGQDEVVDDPQGELTPPIAQGEGGLPPDPAPGDRLLPPRDGGMEVRPFGQGPGTAAAPPVGPERVSQDAKTALARARSLVDQGDWANARKHAYVASQKATSAAGKRDAETLLGKINSQMAFSAVEMDEKVIYKVKRGDALSKIAQKYGTTTAMIMRLNNLTDPNKIRPGQSLHILDGKWSAEVDVSDRTLKVLLNDQVFKRYSVGVGREGQETPTGNFTVVEKEKDPVWYKDGRKIPFGDPRNELGTRWMGWDKDTFGIHGTNDNSSIGKFSSSGCVRMRNSDVEEVFDILPYKAEVNVLP